MAASPHRREGHPAAPSSSFVPDPSGSGGWTCPHCQGVPTHLRAAGWYFARVEGGGPPPAEYVRRHLAMCTGFAAVTGGGGSQFRQQQGQGQQPPSFPHQSPPPPSWPPAGAAEQQRHRHFAGVPPGASPHHRPPYDPPAAAGPFDDYPPAHAHYPGQQDPWRPPTTPSLPHAHLRAPQAQLQAQASLAPGTSPYDLQQQQMLLHQMQLQQQSYALELQQRQQQQQRRQQQQQHGDAVASSFPGDGQAQPPGESSAWAAAPPRGGGGGGHHPHQQRHQAAAVARGDVGEDAGISYASGDAAAAFLADLSRRENLEDARDAAVLPGDRLLLTDYFYHLNQQLRLCRFTEADRKTRGGKREKTPLGYGGLECRHCATAAASSAAPPTPPSPTKPGSPPAARARKFFWSDVDRLANSFAEISGHVLKCRRCPDDVRAALRQLKMRHPAQISRLPRGSQKVFFRRMWRRMHATDATPEVGDEEQPGTPTPPADDDDDGRPPSAGAIKRGDEDPGEEEGPATPPRALISPDGRVLLAIPEDGQWLSDLDCFVRRSLEVFCAAAGDAAANRAEHGYNVKIGQVGIRCVYCASSPAGATGSAVSYPYSLTGVHETVREIERLHLDRCPNLPEEDRGKLRRLQTSASLSSVLRRYYVVAARAIGLVETTNDGLRVEGGPRRLGRSVAGDSPFDPASLRTDDEEGGAARAAYAEVSAPQEGASKPSPRKRKEVPEPETGDEESDPVSKKSSF